HHVRQQPGEQHGQRRGYLSGAAALQEGHSDRSGYRRLHQRHAGVHQGGPVLPAAQRLYAQRGLVRGDGHAVPQQRQDGGAHRLPHSGRAEARRG
ncbi:YlxR domain-containing protein, partial [Dysosmobacter welbionis]